MALPLDTRPMLAKAADEIPEGDDFVYEPKWDGFRALVHTRSGEPAVISRDGRSLLRYFPELETLLTGLPSDWVFDGEIVVASSDGLEFEQLQLRIHPADSRVRMLADEIPASLLLFDVLQADGVSLLESPLSERLERLASILPEEPDVDGILERLARGGSYLARTPRTSDAALAEGWLTAYEDRGLDGVVAKRLGDPYRPNKRQLLKIKRKRTCDCVVGGYRLSKDGKGVGSLLLGLYDDDGILHYVGHTSGFSAGERVTLLELLGEIEEEGASFGGGRSPGGQSRWTGGKDPSWVPLLPVLVCEVAYDRMLGSRFRHAVGFVRWRLDKTPESCDFTQTL